jgi:hypothetical protein
MVTIQMIGPDMSILGQDPALTELPMGLDDEEQAVYLTPELEITDEADTNFEAERILAQGAPNIGTNIDPISDESDAEDSKESASKRQDRSIQNKSQTCTPGYEQVPGKDYTENFSPKQE